MEFRDEFLIVKTTNFRYSLLHYLPNRVCFGDIRANIGGCAAILCKILLYHLGIARSSDPNSGSSQFYINLANNTSGQSNLDGNYTVFGRVISGMSIVDQVSKVPVEQPPKYPSQNQNQPVTPIFMTSVTIQKTP